MNTTPIEWAEKTWNYWSGCSKVSQGCKHCYAKVLAERYGAPAFPDGLAWYDAKIAGWWVWGICLWIGAEFATLNGPWTSIEGRLIKGEPGDGVYRNRPDGQGMGINGRNVGINRQRFSMEPGGVCSKELNPGVDGRRPDMYSRGVHAGIERSRPQLGNAGTGVQKRLLHLSSSGQGIHSKDRLEALFDWFEMLAERLFRVRVCSGDWKRVMGDSVTIKHVVTAVFLDPPYEQEGRDARCYVHDENVWEEVWPWCLEQGSNPLLRIALSGYEGAAGGKLVEAGWVELPWKAQGGYGAGMGKRGEENRHRERIWFSPHCLGAKDVPGQLSLLEGL